MPQNTVNQKPIGNISLFVPVLIIMIVVGSVGALFLRKSKDISKYETKDSVHMQNPTQNSPSQAAIFRGNLAETYTNNTHQYKVKYPKSWEVDASLDNPLIFLRAQNGTNSVSDGSVGVMFIATPLDQMKGAKLSTIVDVTRIQLKSQFPLTNFDMEEDLTISDIPGHVFEFTFSEDDIDFLTRYYMLLGEDNIYVMLTAARTDAFKANEKTIEGIVDSFALIRE